MVKEHTDMDMVTLEWRMLLGRSRARCESLLSQSERNSFLLSINSLPVGFTY